jgi:hypothetical protein
MLFGKYVTSRRIASKEEEWKRERRVEDRKLEEPDDCITCDSCLECQLSKLHINHSSMFTFARKTPFASNRHRDVLPMAKGLRLFRLTYNGLRDCRLTVGWLACCCAPPYEAAVSLVLGTMWLLQKMRGSTPNTRQPRNRVPARDSSSMWECLCTSPCLARLHPGLRLGICLG